MNVARKKESNCSDQRCKDGEWPRGAGGGGGRGGRNIKGHERKQETPTLGGGERGRREEGMLTAARMKIQRGTSKVRSSCWVNEGKTDRVRCHIRKPATIHMRVDGLE